MNVDFEHLAVETEGKIAHVTLERPERLNAIHHPIARDLDAASKLLADDQTVRLVTIQGAGRAFCSGLDQKELMKGELDTSIFEPWERALRRFETMDKLVLSLIHGYAIGGGLQIALASDIRVCTPSAELGLTAINESIAPGLGTWRLSRYVGIGRAKKMCILGNLVDGEEALRIGLVDHLVDEDNLQEEFDEVVEQYMEVNSLGARLTMQAVNQSFDLDFEEFLELHLEQQARAMNSDDFEEAVAAYHEDRDPEWV